MKRSKCHWQPPQKQKSYKCSWQKPIGFGGSLTVWHCLNPRRSRFVIFMQFFGLWREMENVQKRGQNRRNCNGTIPFGLRRPRLFFVARDSYLQWSGNCRNLNTSAVQISQFRQVPFFNFVEEHNLCVWLKVERHAIRSFSLCNRLSVVLGPNIYNVIITVNF